MRYKLTSGPVQRPQRVLLYGPEGIGKSTMASQMPNPVFIDVENGTSQLYVNRMPIPTNWDMLVDEARAIAEDPGEVMSIVIDSVDAAEFLCQADVCKSAKKPSIESWGYGKGYVISAEHFQQLLDVLDRCIDAGVNVILVAHSQMRKFERPDEAGAYDRFEVKLNKHIASKVKEWCDAVLFLDYETFVSVDEQGHGKASGGKRVIRTSHNVAWDAKSRWGLPDKLYLDSEGIREVMSRLSAGDAPETYEHPNKELLEDMGRKAKAEKEAKAEAEKPKAKSSSKPSTPKRLKPLFDACQQSGIRPNEVKEVMVEKGKRDPDTAITDWEPQFVEWLMKQWPRVEELVIEWRMHHPASEAVDSGVYDDDIPF